MKNLEDFKCEKIDIDSIFGGRMAGCVSSQRAIKSNARL